MYHWWYNAMLFSCDPLTPLATFEIERLAVTTQGTVVNLTKGNHLYIFKYQNYSCQGIMFKILGL